MRKILLLLAFLASACSPTAESVVLPIRQATVNPISLSLVTHACPSGVAPCAVHFDATGTTDTTVTSRPFHDVQYSWEFGDSTCVAGLGSVAGTWDYGARAGVSSRNLAYGPVAHHVFECAGTFTVTLTAYDGTNTRATTTDIAVTSADSAYPTTATTCYRQAATGTFDGCPSGATQTTQSSCASIASATTAGKRALFRRGDTWTSCSPSFAVTGGHGYVGAFGSGAKPVLTGGNVQISSCSTAAMSDWRFVDLDINVSGAASDTDGIAFYGQADYITMLRLVVRSATGNGINMIDPFLGTCNSSVPGSHRIWKYTTIQDSVIAGAGHYALIIDLDSNAVQGNSVSGGGTVSSSHTIRTGLQVKSIYSNNHVFDSTAGIWTLRAPDFDNATLTVPAGTWSELTVVSDNKVYGTTAANSVLWDIRPTNTSRNERHRNFIFERNWTLNGSNTDYSFQITNSQDITWRNSLFDTSIGIGHAGFVIGQAGVGNGPDGIKLYNNTIASSSTGTFYGGFINSGITDPGGVVSRNNLLYAPNASSPVIWQNSCGTCLDNANTTSSLTTAPPFTTNPPTTANCAGTMHWKPTGTPVQSVTATTVPNFSDFCGIAWPSTWDIGAVKH